MNVERITAARELLARYPKAVTHAESYLAEALDALEQEKDAHEATRQQGADVLRAVLARAEAAEVDWRVAEREADELRERNEKLQADLAWERDNYQRCANRAEAAEHERDQARAALSTGEDTEPRSP